MLTFLQDRRTEILKNPRSPIVREKLAEDLRQVFLRLYAPQTWEELQGEERAQRRRALGLLSSAAVLFLVLAIVAFWQAVIATRNARESKARELAAYASQSLTHDPELSILLGMHAVNATIRFGQPVVPAAEDALHQAILTSHLRLTVRAGEDFVNCVAFSPDGRQLATGSSDNLAKVWDAVNGRNILTLKGHEGRVTSVAWSPDGKRLATGSDDKTVKVWDAVSGHELLVLRGHDAGVSSVAWSPDGKRLVTGSYDRTAKVWDSVSGKGLLVLKGHHSPVTGVAWSPDGERLVIGSLDHTADVWDSVSGRQLLILRGHDAQIMSVAWSPDGKRLATGSSDETAKIWNAEDGHELVTLRSKAGFVMGVAFSADGKRLATEVRTRRRRCGMR